MPICAGFRAIPARRLSPSRRSAKSNATSLRGRDSKILFIAATNFFDDIDDAMKRKGRIDAHILLDNPNETEAIAILNAFVDEDATVTVGERNFMSVSYGRLCEELRRNYALSKYKTADLSNFLNEEVRTAIERDIAAQRPSGADLRTFYRELKEIAFLENFVRDGKLLFNEEALSLRFATSAARQGGWR